MNVKLGFVQFLGGRGWIWVVKGADLEKQEAAGGAVKGVAARKPEAGGNGKKQKSRSG